MAVDNEATPTKSTIENDATSLARRERDLDESDLDPAAFLKSVRELSEKREREDAERFRKLEEEVQKGRQERAARRAERARSISPEKHQVSTPTSNPISRTTTNASLPPISMTPPSTSGGATTTTPQRDSANMEPEKKPAESVPEFKGFGSIKRSSTTSNTSRRSPTPSQRSSEDAPTTTATGLARSGTLTWNRRPQSQVGGSRPPSQLVGSRPQSRVGSRPQSMVASKADTRTTSIDDAEPSRDQIAASLAARDPTWFKQTADRGAGNAAFRKSKDEAQIGESTPLGRRGLPGMSRESTIEPDTQASPDTSESMKSDLMSRGGSVRGSVMSAGSRYSATSTASSGKPDLKALLAEDESQQRASPSFDQASVASNESSGVARTLTMSTSQARLANVNDRPVSPTKGMGGFVQSAMMKRTDSQTKRWTGQPGTSLSRQNSVASTRSGHGGLQGSHSMPRLEPAAGIKEPATDPSRPTSSSTDLTKLVTEQDDDGFIKPALPSHSRSKSVASNYSTNDDVPASPGSPSKRFRSPTKSSWIESSLTRPESPKPTPAKNSQPSWMADLANRNAQRASAESTPLDAPLKSIEDQGSRPGSPTKQTPFGQQLLRRSDSRDLPTASAPATPSNKLKPLRPADKFEDSPAVPRQSNKVEVDSKAHDNLKPHVLDTVATEITQPSADEQRPESLSNVPVEESEAAMAPPQRDVTKSPAPSTVQKPATPESQLTRTRSKSFKSPPPPTQDKPRAEAAPKMPTDFRSQLKSRAPPAAKSTEQPEFLAKFGQLRKTATEKYVAPDVLKANILRGKGDLTQTGGPVKTQRRDELKESLLAKKDDMKKAKEEGRDLPGQAHERKISAEQPKPPMKPEALARRELLSRSDSARTAVVQSDTTREGTPEALARHKSLKSRELPKTSPKPSPKESQKEFPPALKKSPEVKQKQTTAPIVKKEGEVNPIEKSTSSSAPVDIKPEPLSRQTSASSATEAKATKETSKLAARFNPALASMLARGPPSQPPSRSETPVTAGQAFSPPQNAASEPPAAGAPLNDMRKDRARGPKRRKGGAAKPDSASTADPEPEMKPEIKTTIEAPKPSTAPKSAAALMSASLNKSPTAADSTLQDGTQVKEPSSRPQTPPDNSQPNFPRPKASAPPGSMASLMNASLNKSPRPLSFGPYSKEEAREPPRTPGSPATKSHQVESPPLKSPPFKKPQGARAFPGSRDSLMKASADISSSNEERAQTATASTAPPPLKIMKPETPLKASSPASTTQPSQTPTISEPAAAVPDFKGFGASRAQKTAQPEEDKENSNLPSVKAATSLWGRRPSPQKMEAPSKIQLPTKKDEEAAMRSAGLLAASPKPGLGISVEKTGEKPPTPVSAGAPPKPLKSSRSVSGLLAEASPNKVP